MSLGLLTSVHVYEFESISLHVCDCALFCSLTAKEAAMGANQ